MWATRIRAFAALWVALAAVAGTTVGVFALRDQERAANDAERRLIALRLDLIQMQDIPWGASPAETDDPQTVRDELQGAEEGVLAEIDSLARAPGLPERDRFLAHFRRAVEALEQIWRAVATRDDDALGDAPDVSARQIYKSDSVLQVAADRYRDEAEQSGFEETIGSAALVGLLFLAFALYNVRSTRARHHSERAAAELEAARDAALEASRAKSMFLATMSHEIRTPLTTVLATRELLADTDLDDVQVQLLDKMHRAGELLRRLVDEVLDFSRIEAGRVELVSERFDLHALVRDLADSYSTRAAETGVGFEWHLDPDAPRTLMGDRVRLVQIVSNLLDNAFKFTHEGRVTLAVQPLPHPGAGDADPDGRDAVEFVVEDTGIGIPEEDLALMFESFRQVDGSITRRYGGSGLGLAILKELTELMGGSVSVESRLGAGSAFRVRIPVSVLNQPAKTAQPARTRA